MLQQAVIRFWFCFSCCLLLGFCSPSDDVEPAGPLPALPPEQESGEPEFEDLELGSGSSLLHLLHNFPADSPFIINSPEKSLNCTQRFWLPPTSSVCWGNVAEPEEFAKSRLLVLQNRAALQAVSTLSGVEDVGLSYNHQAREEVQGIQSDHQKVEETMQIMETVFISLRERRKEGKEQGVLTSLKERLADAGDAIDGRERMANILERQFSSLEKNLLNAQLRLTKLIQH